MDTGRNVRLHRNRDFVLFWTGQVISATGSQVSGVALPLLVLVLTHSPGRAGLIGALGFLPYPLLVLPAGALADRLNGRRAMVLTESVRALNMLALAAVLLTHHLLMAQIYAAALLEGSCFVFYNTAQSAALSRLVPPEQMADAVARNEAIWGMSALAGPPLGTSLFAAAGRGVPFLVDGLSFVVSAVSVLLLRADLDSEQRAEASTLLADVQAGYCAFAHNRFLRHLAAFTAIGDLLFAGIDLIVLVLARQRIHAAAGQIGLVFTLAAIGGIIGSLLGTRVQSRLRFGQTTILSAWIIGVLFAGLLLAPNLLLLGAIWSCIAVLVSISNTVRFTAQRLTVRPEMQGRVSSVMDLIAFGSLPIGIALTGALLQVAGPVGTVLGIALLLLALAAGASVSKTLRAGPPALLTPKAL